MIVCAHNYRSFFGRIKTLHPGDTVIFTDINGNVFNYAVTEMEIRDPADIDGMAAGEWDLTLFTCTVGGASRVTIRCDRTDKYPEF